MKCLKRLIRTSQLVIVAIFAGTTIFVLDLPIMKVHSTSSIIDTRYVPIGEITKLNDVNYRFEVKKKNLLAIRIQFATFERTNNCDLSVVIRREKLKIFHQVYPCENLKDNVFTTLRLIRMQKEPNENYSIRISSENAQGGNAVTVYATSKRLNGKSLLKMGSNVIPGELKLQFLYGF